MHVCKTECRTANERTLSIYVFHLRNLGVGRIKESSACIQFLELPLNVSEDVFWGALVLLEGTELPSAPFSSILIWTTGVTLRELDMLWLKNTAF